jgi:hypothetical protein
LANIESRIDVKAHANKNQKNVTNEWCVKKMDEK